ncbi:MAG: Crp/Fnr family transcriptional regulator [Pseudomonadota bacterium]
MSPEPAQWHALRQALEYWQPLPDAAWADLAGLFSAQTVETTERLMTAGERTDRFYFITEGLLRLYYLDREGREHNKSFIQAGGFAGTMSAYAASLPSPFDVQALEPSRVLVAHWCDLEASYDRHPILERLGRRFAEWLLARKVQRERDFLELDAAGRYRAFVQAHPSLERRLANYHIASYLGVTDVSLSRIRRKLRAVNKG